MSTFDSLIDALRANLSDAQSWQRKASKLLQEIERLEKCGAVNASPHYRDKKYLYLVHPMKDGKRQREYIGVDPDAVKSALEKVERYNKIVELRDELRSIETKASAVLSSIRYGQYVI